MRNKKYFSQQIIAIPLLFIFTLLSGCEPYQGSSFTPIKKIAQQTQTPSGPTYKVYGKKYTLLTTSKHYQERGVASWYGRRFHKRRTSSGERFNMFSMTAAHKTLPLSTYVQVTNLKNGRKVIVKVNDRGPFISNRLIDLSYAAAKKLKMVGRGIVPVSVKVIKPA